MLLTSSVRYNEEVPHPSGRRQYDRKTQLPSQEKLPICAQHTALRPQNAPVLQKY